MPRKQFHDIFLLQPNILQINGDQLRRTKGPSETGMLQVVTACIFSEIRRTKGPSETGMLQVVTACIFPKIRRTKGPSETGMLQVVTACIFPKIRRTKGPIEMSTLQAANCLYLSSRLPSTRLYKLQSDKVAKPKQVIFIPVYL
ncbi:hypothetical protein PoB_006542300 [Plakobranchus ocellatus]|uniref:Uncharacterized protein n=1 Tax=Plakobranchus ocellatus TaxID=259542 RepID=A0AAV4D4H4_9GAST|nr:hypothetical protein PoB_006542300 [Plakobranchus ocellatus]